MGILDFEMSELLLSRIFFGSCFRKLNAMHRRVCTTGLHVINKVYGHWIPMNKNSIAPCSFCMSRVVFRGPWVLAAEQPAMQVLHNRKLSQSLSQPDYVRVRQLRAGFKPAYAYAHAAAAAMANWREPGFWFANDGNKSASFQLGVAAKLERPVVVIEKMGKTFLDPARIYGARDATTGELIHSVEMPGAPETVPSYGMLPIADLLAKLQSSPTGYSLVEFNGSNHFNPWLLKPSLRKAVIKETVTAAATADLGVESDDHADGKADVENDHKEVSEADEDDAWDAESMGGGEEAAVEAGGEEAAGEEGGASEAAGGEEAAGEEDGNECGEWVQVEGAPFIATLIRGGPRTTAPTRAYEVTITFDSDTAPIYVGGKVHPIPPHTIPYHTTPYHTIPYHTIPYHTIPYHTIPYHTIPYHTIPYHTIPYHTIPPIPYHPIPYHSIPPHSIPYHTIPYHTIPYHTIPYHTIPYHTIPYHTIPPHTIPYHTIPYHTTPYHTIPYHTIPYHTIPYHTIPYHTIPYHTIPYHTTPYHTIPYHTIPYHTIPYHTIPYHTIPYHTIPSHPIPYHTIPYPYHTTIPYHPIPPYPTLPHPIASHPYCIPSHPTRLSSLWWSRPQPEE